jgi:hypothetical protein
VRAIFSAAVISARDITGSGTKRIPYGVKGGHLEVPWLTPAVKERILETLNEQTRGRLRHGPVVQGSRKPERS